MMYGEERELGCVVEHATCLRVHDGWLQQLVAWL
jgi:hypothetical protein